MLMRDNDDPDFFPGGSMGLLFYKRIPVMSCPEKDNGAEDQGLVKSRDIVYALSHFLINHLRSTKAILNNSAESWHVNTITS